MTSSELRSLRMLLHCPVGCSPSMGHAFGACSFVRPPEIDRAGFNGTGALDWIGSSLVFTFLEVWLGSSLVFMCLYWLWIKLRDTEQNTAKLLIAASQNAERYRQACATAALWRERAITAQDCAAAEAQRTFTLIAERESAQSALLLLPSSASPSSEQGGRVLLLPPSAPPLRRVLPLLSSRPSKRMLLLLRK